MLFTARTRSREGYNQKLERWKIEARSGKRVWRAIGRSLPSQVSRGACPRRCREGILKSHTRNQQSEIEIRYSTLETRHFKAFLPDRGTVPENDAARYSGWRGRCSIAQNNLRLDKVQWFHRQACNNCFGNRPAV